MFEYFLYKLIANIVGNKSYFEVLEFGKRIEFLLLGRELTSAKRTGVVKALPAWKALTVKIFLAGMTIDECFLCFIHLSETNYALFIFFQINLFLFLFRESFSFHSCLEPAEKRLIKFIKGCFWNFTLEESF